MQEQARFHEAGELNVIQELIFSESRLPEELYDMESDPWQTHNLAKDPRYTAILADLRRACDTHVLETGDMGFTPEQDLRESMWPDGQQPQTMPPVHALSNADSLIRLSCPTKGATILYQSGEAANNDDWQIYTEPVSTKSHKTLSLMAVRYGYKDSEVVTLKIENP